MGSEEPSWLDQKIAADKIIHDGLEPFWDSLWASVTATCKKLREAYPHRRDCTPRLNDQNSRIRIIPTPATEIESTLEIRLDRGGKRLLVSVVPTFPRAEAEPAPLATYYPAPDIARGILRFSDRTRPVSPLQLAEYEICNRLLGMKHEDVERSEE